MIQASNRTTNFHYAIRNVVQAAEKLERQGRQVIHLNIGDPQAFGFHPPQHVIEAVTRATRDSFTGYAHSSGLLEARTSIAAHASNLGANTTPDDVVITAGASEGADLVLTALVNPGDEVLLPAPGYPIYPAILNKLGAEARYYRLDENNGWRPDANEVRALVTDKTRVLVLINPSNPTGSITTDEATSSLLRVAAEHGLLVISDEVYRELCFATAPSPSSVLAQETKVPLVTLESLSKTHMLSGWRIGWMRFTNTETMRDLVAAIKRLASGRLCSPTPAQYAVKPALEGPSDFVKHFISEIQQRRDFSVARVRDIAGLSCFVPQAAFYLMIKVARAQGANDEELVLDLLQQTGVLVVHGSGFGSDRASGYFRLVYLADEQTLGSAFSGIARYLNA